MKTQLLILFVTFFCLLTATGCWDRQELTDIAIESGIGVDLAEDGKYQVTLQLIDPSKLGAGQNGGGKKEKPFIVVTATGKTILDAIHHIQPKLSREAFSGQGRSIVIGEEIARHGLKQIMDEFTRNPDVRLRTDIFVVRGGKAIDVLKSDYPYERVPMYAALKIHQAISVHAGETLRDFYMAATDEGSSPITSSFVLRPMAPTEGETQQGKTAQFAGDAIFNKELKLVGYLNLEESSKRKWIVGGMGRLDVTASIPNHTGSVTFTMMHVKRKIRPIVQGNSVKMNITLIGIGSIRENNTDLDLTDAKNIAIVESALEQEVSKKTLAVVNRVQKEYGTDIFGFSEAIDRKYPYKWKFLMKNWKHTFSEVQVNVSSKMTIRQSGLTGPPMQIPESEIGK
ncbi:MAG: putative spore germination GerAC family protein [Bacilli bacterium]|nr:putative spore germination GerAC family protein [Bacilli bacterium]